MRVYRAAVDKTTALVERLDVEPGDGRRLRGDNRPLMRHSDGAMHAAVIEGSDQHLGLFGFRRPGDGWARLAKSVDGDSRNAGQPATDSNQNGVYIAYVSDGAGRLAYIADVFEGAENATICGPLTPSGGNVQGSTLQASRGFNSVVYGWRDDRGGVYVGVSRDGHTFPEARLIHEDSRVVGGPAAGIYGDYVVVSFLTADSRYAPSGATDGQYYYAWLESGDGGESWSAPAPLIRDAGQLPLAVAHVLTKDGELERREVRLSGATSRAGTIQMPAWPASPVDSRLFAEMAITPREDLDGLDWSAEDGHVGVLAWKPIELGDSWRYVLTNRSLFRREGFAGRTGSQFKYCALPGSAVRVVAYVDRAGADGPEDHLVLLMSTNMGDSFDHETAFSASQLGLDRDADLVIANSLCCHIDGDGNIWQDMLIGNGAHEDAVWAATLPTGLNIQGFDPTMHW